MRMNLATGEIRTNEDVQPLSRFGVNIVKSSEPGVIAD
jgi:hypothetical protein